MQRLKQIQSEKSINLIYVARDVALLFCLVWIGGLADRLIISVFGITKIGTILTLIARTGPVVLIFGFCLSGCLVKVDRFAHLGCVLLFFWLACLVNVVRGVGNLGMWIVALLDYAVCMVMGGGLSLLFVRDPGVKTTEQ